MSCKVFDEQAEFNILPDFLAHSVHTGYNRHQFNVIEVDSVVCRLQRFAIQSCCGE